MSRQRLISKRLGYASTDAANVLTAPSSVQLELLTYGLINASALMQNLGLGISFSSSSSSIFSLVSGALANFSNTLFTTSANDGFIIQSSSPCDLLALKISQAQAGSPIYEYSYWNGSSWTVFVPQVVPSSYAVGMQHILFPPSYLWVKGGNYAGLDSNKFSLRVRATTAPSQAVQVSAYKICKLITYRESVEAAQSVEANFMDSQYLLEQGEGLYPYFSIPSINNAVELVYRLNP